ncbi:VWA1 protein, partial [Ramphastos sulfuratus]|nr:VWA1 protein [Ramphastos sulfuratus]
PLPGPHPSVSNSEGDLLFLLDSSGSVSYYEFSRVKEFIWDLLQPFTFGPKDVQTSIIHISTTPTMEFPFDRHQSAAALHQAIRNTQQLMGDTNTGKALSYAKEKLFSGEAGARPEVPKVLVWVTDGFSTDDISEAMQLLKDMGVTVFIVSTGHSNYLELSAAASQPPEKHLHFVDVDDLPIITQELRDGILDVIQANRLHAVDVTSSSFRLVWPKLLSQETDYYTLEYAPRGDLGKKRTQQVSGVHTTLLLSNLAPETTYEVALIPESNTHYFPPQITRVTTLAAQPQLPQALLLTELLHSFQHLCGSVLDSLQQFCVPLELGGPELDTVLQICSAETGSWVVRSTSTHTNIDLLSLEGSKVRHLRFEDMGPNTLKASWDSADGKVLGYRVRCRRQTGPSSLLSVSPQTHSVLLTDLPAGTTSKVCVKPMYKNQAGRSLCRMVHMQPATEAQGYKHRQRA